MTVDIRRLTRRQLYDLVWKTPVDTLARDFGMSGRGLGKLCERHSIPVPPRGYWARKGAGQRVKRPPLVEIEDSRHPEIVVDLRFRPSTKASDVSGSDVVPDPYQELFERQLKEVGAIQVGKQLRNPHRVIAGWLKQEDSERRRAQHSFYRMGSFQAKYAAPLARRRLRILNVLFRELERRGCKIEEDRTRQGDLTVRFDRDSVDFTLSERIRQIRRRLTDEEKAKSYSSRQDWMQVREPTGELILKLSKHMPQGVPPSWKDEQKQPLETKLSEILAGFLTALAIIRGERESREAEERLRRAREEEERRLEAERQAELARKLGLRQRANAWRAATHIREYVAAVQDAAAKGGFSVEPPTIEEWSNWALAHADEVDPLRTGNAVKTDPLWNEERPGNSSYGNMPRGHTSGDPDWFWGQRWWLKS